MDFSKFTINIFVCFCIFSCRLPVTIFDDVEDAITYEASTISYAPKLPENLKVMTWNIRYGAARIPWFEDSCGDRVHMTESEVTSHLDFITQYINTDIDTIDILLLQEVDVSSKRSAYVDQIQYLLESTYFNYAVYGSMWKSDLVPSGGLGKVDVGVAILSRWPLTQAERIQLPLREDQPGYEKYFYLRRCMLKTKIEIENWENLYAVDIHAVSFSTDDTKQKHIVEYKSLLDKIDDDGFSFITGGDLNAIPPAAEKFDYCEEDQCPQDAYSWHTVISNDSTNYHRKGSYYNNFQEIGSYPSERNLLTLLYNSTNYYPGIAYEDRNNSDHFTYGAYNTDNTDKSYHDRKLDYLFTNHSNWSQSGNTHQDAKAFSDHIPVSAILYK